MIDDSGVVTGLTAPRSVSPARQGGLARCSTPKPPRALAAQSPPRSPTPSGRRPTRARQVAYVIYTSGSTGLPKGVVVTHAGWPTVAAEFGGRDSASTPIRACAHAARRASNLGRGDAGALRRPAPPRGGPAARRTRARKCRSAAHASASPISTDHPGRVGPLDPATLPDLRRWSSAATPAGRSWSGAGRPGARVLNGYGPTETTDHRDPTSTAALRAQRRSRSAASVRGMRAVVLDRWLRPVPAGRVGRAVPRRPGAGARLPRRRRPDRRTVRRRTRTRPGERMYRTGDLVRWTRRDGPSWSTWAAATSR